MPPLQQQRQQQRLQQQQQQQQQQRQAARLADKRAPTDSWDSSDSDFEEAPAGGASGSSRQPGKAKGRPLGAASLPAAAPKAHAQLQQMQQQAAGKGVGKPKPLAAGQKRQHPHVAAPAAKKSQPGGASKKPRPAAAATAGAAAAKPPAPRPRKQQQPISANDSSDDDDNFVAGSLRQAPEARQLPKAVAPAAKPAPGRKSAAAKSGGAAPGAAAGAAAAAGSVFGSRVEVIRLDALDYSRWPGWQASVAGIRQVAPYQPALAAAAEAAVAAGEASAAASPHSRVLLTSDILSFDLSQCGSGFQGLLIDAAGAAPAAAAVAALTDSSGGSSSSSGSSGRLTVLDQLSGLELGAQLMSCGLLFLWAAKAQTAQAVRWMAARGFKYVENLTWQQLGPNNKPLLDTSPLFRRSHLTLLMGRRGQEGKGQESKGHLELRHQRTPDVIISPALPPGRCPEAVYSMIETLLPESAACKAAKSGSSGGPLRLLELSFNGSGSSGGGERCGRPGWVRLVQSSG